MAFDMQKLYKFAPFVGVYAFYNVFAKAYPADPIAGMKTALSAFMADPLTKLKAKSSNIMTLAVVIIGVPIVLKAAKLPVSLKMVANIITYYIIGDQCAALINGPGVFGAGYGAGTGSYNRVAPVLTSWGGADSAFHQEAQTMPTGTIKNIYGG